MNKIDALRSILSGENLDGFFTSSVPNITYLTNFKGDSSRLFVSRNRIILITDGRYTEQAARECFPNVEVFNWIDNKRYARETYSYIIAELGIKKLGFEGNLLTYSEHETLKLSLHQLELKNTSGLVENLRKQKTTEEIANLKKACEISDRALEKTISFIKEGVTELDIVAQLEYQLKRNGAEGLSFDTMVLFGSRTSLLHGKPGNTKIKPGDFILFDFGALYGGYHADISRTFVLGSATQQQKEIYNIIKEAQAAAVSAIKSGIDSKIADNEVRRIIPEKYIEYYYPGLGHGVGLEIHETPFLGRDYQATLEENMVITIEPGIYIPNWGGIRIEDTIVVNQEKATSLSNFPRELITL